MAWLYVPGLEASSLGSRSPSQTIAVSVTSNGKPSPRPPSWPGWKSRPWIRHLSGTTLPPSTAERGVERWISCLLATRANPSRRQAGGEASRTNGTYGPTSPASSARSSPRPSSWRTSPATYVWDSTRSSQTWERWVTGLQRDCSARLKLARAIGASGSSVWPTANATDGKGASQPMGRRPACDDDLPSRTAAWPSPAERDWRAPNSEASQERRQHQGGEQLVNFVEHQWPTPAAVSYGNNQGGGMGRVGPIRPSLENQSRQWPTPRSGDGEKMASLSHRRREAGRAPDTLTDASRQWPTVRVCSGKRSSGANRTEFYRAWSGRSSPQDRATPAGPTSSTSSRRLNPLFVEWLMGWPIGWTGSGCSETELCLYRRRLHTALCQLLSQLPAEPDGQLTLQL